MGEYISREAVLEKAKSSISVPTDNEWDCGYNTAMAEMREFIKQLPSAQVQPVKRGKWESSQRTIETGTVYCSNCAIEYYISDLQTVGDYNGIVHYCPNCGARMDLGDEKT